MWSYECIDNDAVLKKSDSLFQIVIDGELSDSNIYDYSLWVKDGGNGSELGRSSFICNGRDTISFTIFKGVGLSKDKQLISEFQIYKQAGRNN